MFENLLARSSSLAAFQHEKEETLAGLWGKFAGLADFFFRAEILWPPLNTKIGMTCCVFYSYFVMILSDIAPKLAVAESQTDGLVWFECWWRIMDLVEKLKSN